MSAWVVAVSVEALAAVFKHGYGSCRGIPAAGHDVVLCRGQSGGGFDDNTT